MSREVRSIFLDHLTAETGERPPVASRTRLDGLVVEVPDDGRRPRPRDPNEYRSQEHAREGTRPGPEAESGQRAGRGTEVVVRVPVPGAGR